MFGIVLEMYFIHIELHSSGLLSKLLLASPGARITITDIQKDRWFTQGRSQYQYNRINSTQSFMSTGLMCACVSLQV